MTRLPNKKIIIIAAILLSAGILLTAVHFVWAQAPPVAPTGGRALSAAGKLSAFGFDVTSTVLAVLGVLTILQSVLTQLLALVSFFLDNLFKFNTVLLPNAMPVVYSGWTAMRDITNALFILILLWIAFTIIFNIENLGGKKLLARLIIIAILINFSLTMVSFVFGFANALAKPFQKAINTSDVAGLIVGKTNLHNITSQLNDTERTTLESYGINQEELDRTYIRPQEGMSSVDQQKFLPFAVGPEEARAQAGGAAGAAIAGCGIASLLLPIFPGLSCAGGAIIGAVAKAVGSWALAVGVTAISWKMILNLAVSNLFLILTIFALTAAGILLLGRIIAMVFVAVLAPTAFLAYTIPGKYGQKYWDMWLDSLLKWSFVAPAFYFLFWVSLLVLDKMQSTIPVTNQFSGNTLYIFTLIVFLGFLFASITIAKKMGITVADSFIKWGQKAGWKALGAAGVGIGAMAKRAATTVIAQPKIQKALGGLANIRQLRFAGGAYPQRAAIKFIETQRARIKKEEASIESYNKEQTLSDYAGAVSSERKVALINRIASQGWLRDFQQKYKDDPNALKNALNMSARYGMQYKLLELRPDLIDDATAPTLVSGATNKREAVERIIKIIPDLTKISPESALDPEVQRAVLLNVKGHKQLQRIALENNILLANLKKYYDNPDNRVDLDQGYRKLNDQAPGAERGEKQREMLGSIMPDINLVPLRAIFGRRSGAQPGANPPAGRRGAPPPATPPPGDTDDDLTIPPDYDEDNQESPTT